MAPKLLNILLQRNDSNVPWGFRLSGGKELAKPLTIVKVFPGTLAAQYFVPGDIVLGIQGYSTRDLLHVEAIDLIREPVKSLQLLVRKSDDVPASIWGPVPVLQRPSEWLRRSASPLQTNTCGGGYRPASMLRQHFEDVNQSAFQQETVVRTGYTPTALDSRIKQQQFESTEIPQTIYQTQVINEVSSVAQYVANDFNQPGQYGNNTYHIQTPSQVSSGVHQVSHSLQKPQENHQVPSETPQTTHNVLEHQENVQNSSDNNVKENKREQNNDQSAPSGAKCMDERRIKPVTEKPRIPTTGDVLMRPISPEFTMFPNNKSNSLLKLVLNKSLGNYSPQDFEKMKASFTEMYDGSDDDEDSDTEEEDDEDEDTEDGEEGDNEGETQDEDAGSESCESSLAGSGSVIFERCWVTDEEWRYSEDSEQYGRSPSRGSFSSQTSGLSPLPDTPEEYTGAQETRV